MIAKIWKKVLFIILIIVCLFNIVFKLVKKKPLNEELETSAQYIQQQELENNTEKWAINIEKNKKICYYKKQHV